MDKEDEQISEEDYIPMRSSVCGTRGGTYGFSAALHRPFSDEAPPNTSRPETEVCYTTIVVLDKKSYVVT